MREHSRTSPEITRLLVAFGDGDRAAFDRLMPLVYAELQGIARRQLRRLRPGDTLGTTGLVHEAYIKLVDQEQASWRDRNHFFSIAGRAMRQILVNYVLAKQAEKRGGGRAALELDEARVAAAQPEMRLLDLPPDERPTALDMSCDGDEALRATVVRLLNAADAPRSLVDPEGGWTDILWRGLAAQAAVRETPIAAGAMVGPYRILEEIERGGMAVVYRAERVDGELDRQVAIKVLKLGLDTEEIVRRFEQERQILADLDHPNIARVYDAGRTQEGRPYFVMELVEGVPIDRYCDEHRLSVEERLELFCAVTGAVDYAHQNLVVHRDLKPSNILVSGDGAGVRGVGHGGPTLPEGGAAPRRVTGQVKLLDFGIARLLDVEAGGGGFAAAPTRALVRMMTPEYASPEQVRGERVTTASDVYQLGVLLYELLTGCRPYALAGRGAGELERAICEQVLTRPSSALGRGNAGRETREASTSAAQSAAVGAGATAGRDPGRFRREEAADKGLKWPTSVSAEKAVEATGRARRTSPARLRRRLRGDLDNIVLHALRKEPERRYRTADRLAQDIWRHLDGLPVTARADTWIYRGRKFLTRHALGATATALLLLTAAGVAVFHVARVGSERDRAQAEAAKAEEVSQFLTGLFESADPREARGAELTARELLDRGTAQVERELAAQPELKAQMLQVLGRTYLELGAYEEAESALVQALALLRDRLPRGHTEVAMALHDMGRLRVAQGEYKQAQRRFEQAVRILERSSERNAPELAQVLGPLGLTHRLLGEYGKARENLERALEIETRGSGSRPEELATILRYLSGLYIDLGDLEQSEELRERVLRIQERELGADHPVVGNSLQNLANIQVLLGKTEGAEALYRRSLAIAEKAFGPSNVRIWTVLNNLGHLLILEGRNAEADEVLRRALKVLTAGSEPSHPQVVVPLASLGDAHLAAGRPREARDFYQRGVAVRTGSVTKERFDPVLFYLLVGLGRSQLELGDSTAAARRLQEALEIWTGGTESVDPRLASPLLYLGRWLVEHGRCAEATPLLRRAVEVPIPPLPIDPQPPDADSLLAACGASIGS